jgi:hypothetical protein
MYLLLFLGIFSYITISSSFISYSPTSSLSCIFFYECSFINIKINDSEACAVYMRSGGNIEFSTCIFQNISVISVNNVFHNVLILIVNTEQSSFEFLNNIFANISCKGSSVVLKGKSKGVYFSNNSFESISSDNSGGVFFFNFCEMYFFIFYYIGFIN